MIRAPPRPPLFPYATLFRSLPFAWLTEPLTATDSPPVIVTLPPLRVKAPETVMLLLTLRPPGFVRLTFVNAAIDDPLQVCVVEPVKKTAPLNAPLFVVSPFRSIESTPVENDPPPLTVMRSEENTSELQSR